MRCRLAVMLALIALPVGAMDMGMGMGKKASTDQWVDLQSRMVLSPTSYDFGSHDTGTTTDKVFTLSNPGNDVLEAVSLATSGAGYSMQTDCGANPFDLASGASCTATVRFAPLSAGTLNGSLIASAPNLSNATASVTGVGVSAVAYNTVFSDDFNRADSATVGGSWTGETDLNGILSITGNAMVAANSATNYVGYVSKTITAASDVKVQFDLKLSSTTITNGGYTQVASILGGGTNAILELYANGGTTLNAFRVKWWDGSNTVQTSSAYAFSFQANTSYTVSFYYKNSSSTGAADGAYRADVGGSTVVTNTAVSTFGRTSTSVRNGIISVPLAQTLTCTFDNFSIGTNP